MTRNEQSTTEDVIESWLAERDPTTAAEYRHDVEQYRQWCRQHGLDPLAVKLPDVQRYAEHLAEVTSAHGKPLSARSRHRKLAAVSSFYTHAARAGAVDYNPAREVERPRYDRRHSPTTTFDEREARDLLAAALTLRQRVMAPQAWLLTLSAMIVLGGRVTEVCNVNLTDLGTHAGSRTITLGGASAAGRLRPIPAELAPVLDDWLQARPAVDENALIVDFRGHRITRKQIAKLLARLATQIGTAVRITPESCRRAFNDIAAAHGAPAEARKKALGNVTELDDTSPITAADLAADPAHLVSAIVRPPEAEQAEGNAT